MQVPLLSDKYEYDEEDCRFLHFVETSAWCRGPWSPPPYNECLFLLDSTSVKKKFGECRYWCRDDEFCSSFMPQLYTEPKISSLSSLKLMNLQTEKEKKCMNWTSCEHYTATRKWFLGLEGEAMGELVFLLPCWISSEHFPTLKLISIWNYLEPWISIITSKIDIDSSSLKNCTMILLSAWNNLNNFNILKLDLISLPSKEINFSKIKWVTGNSIFPIFPTTGLIVLCGPRLLMTRGTKNDINDVTSLTPRLILPISRDMTLLTRIKTWEPRLDSEGKWKFYNYLRQKDPGLVRLWENGTFDSLRDRSHKDDGENSWNLVLISTKNEESVTIKKWIPGSFNQDWQFNFRS